jgi:NADH:ubiquinone oxidoreductase subunit F (NADH-binding)/(2Fe-2S) ferredoxin
MKVSSIRDLEKLKAKGMATLCPNTIKIMVGMATCGQSMGAGAVFDAIAKGVQKNKINALVKKTGCIGMCHEEPLVDVLLPGSPRITYSRMDKEKAAALVDALRKGVSLAGALGRMDEDEFLLEDTVRPYKRGKIKSDMRDVPAYKDLAFYKRQKKIALRNCGTIDPEDICEYIAKGGYFSLARILAGKSPDEVIDEVERSGLRGRGGAGFLTGRKWRICREAEAKEKYIICNADEGDPGAYMDRSLLEGDPHAIIEGMIIAGFAIGAQQGFIYVRAEYPLALERLRKALKQAQAYGLLGRNIFNSGFKFAITIIRGAGAFVCGEETALIKSIEGDWGEPRQRPPFPAQRGLWGKPTVINNVETFANIAPIMARGASWFSSLGTKHSKGTKVFSLVGKVKRIGLVEVPMGTSLKQLIYDIGGGIPNGRTLKAVQTGGPSGGCIPRELINLPVDYEALAEAGSIMGSGGLIVMDDRTCMVDVAKYFVSFLADESCGKCTPCRVGITRMKELLEDITAGRGSREDLVLLENMADAIKESALCGLGRTAPNPVLSTLIYFKDEYLAHIKDKKCPAGVCRALITYTIDRKRCTGCGACVSVCPVNAIAGEKKQPHVIAAGKCIKCGACFEICPAAAILK